MTSLPSTFRGELLAPGDARLAALPPVFDIRNAQRRPALVARCADAHDVAAVLRTARADGVELVVRGCGQSLCGHSTTDGGVVIDVGALQDVQLDPHSGRLSVGPGVKGGALLPQTLANGRAPVSGFSPRPGFVGFALHGGRGILSREHGWGSDQIRGAQVVTADGDIVEASADEHAELLYGLRGAGSNYGVVTRLDVETVAMRREIVAGTVTFGAAALETAVPELLGLLDGGVSDALGLVLTFSADGAGAPRLQVLFVHTGGDRRAAVDLDKVRGAGPVAADTVGPQLYDEFFALRATRPAADRFHWVEQGCDELSSAFVAFLLDAVHGLEPSPDPAAPDTAIVLDPFGPGYAAASAHPTPVPRRVGTSVTFATQWHDPALDDRYERWADDGARRLRESGLGTGRPVLNYNTPSPPGTVRRAYGAEAYAHLQAVKGVYDPANVFRHNHNVEPPETGRNHDGEGS